MTAQSLDSAQYHLFLVTGQSNSMGYIGDKNEGLNEPIPVPKEGEVFYFAAPDAIRDAATATAKEYAGARAGFHNEFAMEYARRTGKKVIFIHEVHGNSGIIPGVKYGGGNWPDQYREALRKKYQEFKQVANSDPRFSGKWALAGMIWGQGEAECFLLEQGRFTLEEVEGHLARLFDQFGEDLLADYTGEKGRFINLPLVSIFAYRSPENDRFYPDSPAWAATRDLQRNVARSHPNARMVYFPTERFYLDGVWQPNNSVHFTQKQYNEIGRVMAQEIAEPGSTIKEPTAPGVLRATNDGPWRVGLQWEPVKGGIPGELPCYRIYRRSGEGEWVWVWQTKADVTNWKDENALTPGTAYEYRVDARNEFGQAPGQPLKVMTSSLPAVPVAALGFEGAGALWKELEEAGLTQGLRSLHLAGPKFGLRDGVLPNLVREGDRPERYDLAYQGDSGVANTHGGIPLFASAKLVSEMALIPTTGPYTLLAEVTLPGNDTPSAPSMILKQGGGKEASETNPLTGLVVDRNEDRLRLSGDLQIRNLQSGSGSAKGGEPVAIAAVYDGLHATLQLGDGAIIKEPNTVYFGAVQDARFELGGYGKAEAPGAFYSLAIWNRPLTPAQVEAARAILARYAKGLTREAIVYEKGRVTLRYRTEGATLEAPTGKVGGFEVAGADQRFHPAEVKVSAGEIVVSSPAVPHPAIIRYQGGGDLLATGGQRIAPFMHVNPEAMGQSTAPVVIRFKDGKPSKPDGGTSIETSPQGNVYHWSKPSDAFHFGLGEEVSGFVFNSPVIGKPFFFRRGDLVSWKFELAAGPVGDSTTAQVYFRFGDSQTVLYWDIPNQVQTEREEFVPRSAALLLSKDGPSRDPNTGVNRPKNTRSLSVMLTPIAANKVPRGYKIRGLNELNLIRAALGGELPEKIDLAAPAGGGGVESAQLEVLNAQTHTGFRRYQDSEEEEQLVRTVLYGLADIPATDSFQVVAPMKDGVGAILHGGDAAKFRLVGENVTEDGQGVRLVGEDGKLGLGGGATPEVERFKVRFDGGAAGTYRTTLRIVTQAANRGRLSFGSPGEPPIHLYYLDIPVSATVAP